MREVYRMNQHYFGEFFSKDTFGMHAVFIANKETLTYSDISRDMIPLLNQAREKLSIMSKKIKKNTPDANKRQT